MTAADVEVLRARLTGLAEFSAASVMCGLFDRQDAAYRRAVIDRQTVRVAVEASVRQGWERYIGEDGGFVGMTGFGASGHERELFEHFGITPERVAAEVRGRLCGENRLGA